MLLNVIVAILVSINLGTFLLYGFDKLSALMHWQRIPEKTLWLSAFLGGSLGAVAGMYLFRHKTKKTSFQFVLAVLVLVQIALVILYLKYHTSFLPE